MRALLSLLLLTLSAAAAPSPRAGHVVHEKRARDPTAWEQTRRLEADKILPLRIGLSQSNLDKIEDILMSVSHPKSESYGKHLMPAEVVDTFAPSAATVNAVKEWLADFGFADERLKLSKNKGWLHVVNASAEEIENLLDTEYHVYTHMETGEEQISKSSLYISTFHGLNVLPRLPCVPCPAAHCRAC